MENNYLVYLSSNRSISDNFPFGKEEFEKLLIESGFTEWNVTEKSIWAKKVEVSAEIDVDFNLLINWCRDELWLRNNDITDWAIKYILETLNQNLK